MDLSVDELFTRDSLLTLQGGAAAAWVVPTVIDYIFLGRTPKWLLGLLSLLIGLGLQAYAAARVGERTSWTWVVAAFNGFLIAFTALGLNKTAERVLTRKETPAPAPQPVPAAPGAAYDAERAVGAPAPAQAPAPRAAKRKAGFSRGWL